MLLCVCTAIDIGCILMLYILLLKVVLTLKAIMVKILLILEMMSLVGL